MHKWFDHYKIYNKCKKMIDNPKAVFHCRSSQMSTFMGLYSSFAWSFYLCVSLCIFSCPSELADSTCCSWQLVFPLINPPVIIARHTGPREACSDAITSCRASRRTISTSKRLRGLLLPTGELTGWARANGMCRRWASDKLSGQREGGASAFAMLVL